jgi:hypothetical protein
MVLVAIDAINASRIVDANRLSDWNMVAGIAASDLNQHYDVGYFVTRHNAG